MPAAIAIPAAISAGTSIFGGIMGSRAANKSANQIAEGNRQAGQVVQNAVGQVNPALQKASDQAISGVNTAVTNAQTGMGTAVSEGNAYLDALGNKIDTAYSPYTQAGQSALGKLSGLADEKFQFSQDDPSYQWRLQQGTQALQRSAAARGSVLGGGTMKALTRYAQGAASTEYQAAFDRFQADRASRGGILGNLAGMGLTATGGMANADLNLGGMRNANTMRGAEYIGNAGMTGAEYGGNMGFNSANAQGQNTLFGARTMADLLSNTGQARGAGTMGSANAWSGMAQGIGNAAMGYGQGMQMRDFMNRAYPQPQVGGVSDPNFSAWLSPAISQYMKGVNG